MPGGSKERARRRAREHYERQRQARMARRKKIQRWTLTGLGIAMVAALAVGLSLSFVGGGTSKAASSSKATAKATASPTPSPSATATAAAVAEPAHHCTYTASAGSKPSLPPATPDWAASYTATISTNRGPIVIKLANSKATCTVNSFVHLAEAGFWGNTQCHRVSDSGGLYMLQCGDPTAKASEALSCSSATLGTGGPGYEFNDENLTGATYPAGTVAMANSGANTNGSQFFLVFANTSLPASYTPFGTITTGLDTLQNVAKAGTSCTMSAGGGVPKEKVIINSVSIKKA
jgi:peptidyl-prolyl cis-trans isomerase B (cyclophilin B)